MTEYVTLLGAEAVERAGREMTAAAEQITRALQWEDDNRNRFLQRSTELVDRLEAILTKLLEARDD